MKNNKGFTLIELIIVLVILTTIMLVAIPSVSSSVERRKEKDKNYRIDLLVSAAEVYADINRYDFPKDSITIIPIDDIICSGLINKNQIVDPYNTKYILNVEIKYNSSDNTIIWNDKGPGALRISATDKTIC